MKSKSYRYRIYPTKEQEVLLSKTFGCVRVIWNRDVAVFNSWDKETNPFPDLPDLDRDASRTGMDAGGVSCSCATERDRLQGLQKKLLLEDQKDKDKGLQV